MKAVVFVDVQKDFIDGALRNERAIEVTPKIVEFAKQCAADPNCKLYATRDTHKKTECTPVKYDGNVCYINGTFPVDGYLATLEGQKLPVEHCIEGTDGWMIDDKLMDVFFVGYAKDEIGVEDKDHPVYSCTFVNKPTFGSFDLVEVIGEDQIKERTFFDEIVLCGFCTDICCVSCALLLRAKFPNTKITIKKDLCAGTTIENHEAALKVMQSCQIDIV